MAKPVDFNQLWRVPDDRAEVADVFARALAHAGFQGRFDRVVFAIYDRAAEQRTFRAFEDRFRSQA